MEQIFLDWARQIHKEHPVVDAHFDLAAEVYERRLAGERNVVEKRYLPCFRQAGLNVLVSSIYVSDRDLPEQGLRRALGQIAALHEDLEPVKDQICVVTSKKGLDQALWEKKIAVLLSLEGLDPLGSDLMLLRIFYDLGVRGAGLTWSRRNAFATGCCKAGEFREIPGGITELGREAVRQMEALGMWVDVSHLNLDGFKDLCACAEKPFIASHSNAWEIHPNYRNLKDDQIEAVAARGGVIGVNACTLLAGPNLEQLCRHAEYLAARAGKNCVGIGFDLCRGLYETTPRIHFETENDDLLAHHGEMEQFTAMLLARGMREEAIIGLLGENFLRFFRQVLPET